MAAWLPQVVDDDVDQPGTERTGLPLLLAVLRVDLAVDLCGGVESFGTTEHAWMIEHGPAFGWIHPLALVILLAYQTASFTSMSAA